jgi:exopolysaccharide biosynthesis protein
MTYRRRHRTPPHLLSSSRVTRVRHRGLWMWMWNGILVGITLILLLFPLQNGRAATAKAGRPLTARIALSTNQAFSPAYWRDFYTSHRLHYLARLRLISAEKLLALNNDPSSTLVSRGVVLSREVLQTAFGPEQLFMLNVDLTSPNVRFGVVQAYNRLISPDETLTSMANRTGAVAGINGDFFEIHGSGVPIGEEVINGQLLHSPNPHFYAVLGVTSSGRLTIGAESFSGSVVDGGASHTLFSVNHYSEIYNGRLLLFTPVLGRPVYAGGDPVALLQPLAGSPGVFKVRSIRYRTWLSVLAGQQALLGSGDAGYWLANTLHAGDHISITEHLFPDAHPIQAIGGGSQVVKDGALYYDPNSPAPFRVGRLYPLTAVGVTKDGNHALFVVFDGRRADPVGSVGLTAAEAARFMLAHGAYNAMLFDGGGSSEMVARLPGQHAMSVINWPSGGYERRVANGLFILSDDA